VRLRHTLEFITG